MDTGLAAYILAGSLFFLYSKYQEQSGIVSSGPICYTYGWQK
jgi:hypothetical protein